MLKLFLWLRYLRKKRIVLLSISAVGLSTALLIIVSSLFTGFIRTFEQAAVEAMGDVVLTPPPPKRIAEYPLFIERLERTGLVEAATATLSSQGLLRLAAGNVRAVKIWGIEPGKRARVTRFKQALRKQSHMPGEPSFETADLPDKVGGFVGVGVVAEPSEETDEYDFESIEQSVLGREVVVVTGAQVESGAGKGAAEGSSSGESGAAGRFARRNIPFTVTDVVFSGVYYLDKSMIYLPIEELQRKLYPDEAWPTADQIQIKLAGDVNTEVALAVIRGVWEEFAATELGWSIKLMGYTEIETSKEMQRQYVVELLKQMGVLLLIFGMVSCGVVVLVFCIFYMIVRLKQKDVGVIKSCGGSSSSVALLFVGFGVFVGMIGSGLGIVVAYIITKNVNTIEEWIRILFGLKLWKSSVYMFNRIPNEVNWHSVWVIVLLAVAAVTAGVLLPAVIAARTRPVNILRYE
ncbi:MAG: ABC transporter permease [Planctomycetota bacterium]|jgi:lipoprotein-releasing system permease protein